VMQIRDLTGCTELGGEKHHMASHSVEAHGCGLLIPVTCRNISTDSLAWCTSMYCKKLFLLIV
jgi:hypothetical protein